MISGKQRRLLERLVRRDGDRCHYCRLITDVELDHAHPRRQTIDHVVPKSKGGKDVLANMVIACNRCNGEKANMPYEMFRWYRHMVMRGHNRAELLCAIEQVSAEISAGVTISGGAADADASLNQIRPSCKPQEAANG